MYGMSHILAYSYIMFDGKAGSLYSFDVHGDTNC